jgi:hypothetical protein
MAFAAALLILAAVRLAGPPVPPPKTRPQRISAVNSVRSVSLVLVPTNTQALPAADRTNQSSP